MALDPATAQSARDRSVGPRPPLGEEPGVKGVIGVGSRPRVVADARILRVLRIPAGRLHRRDDLPGAAHRHGPVVVAVEGPEG